MLQCILLLILNCLIFHKTKKRCSKFAPATDTTTLNLNSRLLTYVIILRSLAPWEQDRVFWMHSRSLEVNSVTSLLTNPNQGHYCNDVKPSSCIYSRFLSVWLFAGSDSSYEMKCSVPNEITENEKSGCEFKSFKKKKKKKHTKTKKLN